MARSPYELPRLREGLRPFRLHYFPRLRSTNDHAAVLRKRGELFAPAAILTAIQTAGRGRGGNSWFASAGSITVTFALPIEEYLAPHQLPLAAGLAARHCLAELAGEAGIALKWPNDIVYDGMKLAGVLCERIHRVDLVGIGINLNLDPAEAPAKLRGRMTSMLAIAGRRIDPTDALIALAKRLRQTLAQRHRHPFAALVKEYDQHHALVGRMIAVQMPGGTITGKCEGLDQRGRLLLRDREKIHSVVAGHVYIS